MPLEVTTWTDSSSRTNSTGGVSYASVSCSNSRITQANPNWRSLLRNGQDATTPFSASMNSYRSDSRFKAAATIDYYTNGSNPVFIKRESKTAFGAWMRFTSCTDPTTYSLTNANNQALKYFVQKANAVQRSVQGGVFIGELREALRLIRNPAMGLRKGLNSYLDTAKKRSIKAVRSTRSSKRSTPASRHKSVKGALSDSWLEGSFGWLPLMNDIDSGAKALARLNYLQYQPIDLVMARGESGDIIEAAAGSGTIGTGTWSYDSRVTIRLQVQYKAGIKTAAPNARPFAEFGLMPRDFVPTVWELIPWSFVADYFTNIGDILEGYSFNRSSVAWCCKTTRRIAEKRVVNPRFTTNISDNDRLISHSFRPGKPTWDRKEVVRVKYAGTFVPDFSFEIPGMGTKWINLAALSVSSRSASRFVRGLI